MAKSAPRKKVTLPRYNDRQGRWIGGDDRTLYTFTGRRTGEMGVYPGGGSGKHLLMNWGPEADVRVATRGEAEKHWQNPLHVGWKTSDAAVDEPHHNHATKKASSKKTPPKTSSQIGYWIRSRGGPRSSWDIVPVYVLGTTTREDEGIVGHDLRVRPLRLGKGAYTMVVSPDDVEDEP